MEHPQQYPVRLCRQDLPGDGVQALALIQQNGVNGYAIYVECNAELSKADAVAVDLFENRPILEIVFQAPPMSIPGLEEGT